MARELIVQLDNPFWQFSIRLYKDKDIRERCLYLQNTKQANVNLLLLSAWLAYAVEPISEHEFRKACNSIADWHIAVTEPLRTTRCYLKTISAEDYIDAMYQQLLADELNSEAYQQHKLYQFFINKQKSHSNFERGWMRSYLDWLLVADNLLVNLVSKACRSGL